METNKATIGDVIRASEFEYGYYSYIHEDEHLHIDKSRIFVDGETKSRPIQFRKPGTPWDKPAEYFSADIGAYDPSRGEALFVVERAEMTGGGTGHGAHDVYPDGWNIAARRLHQDGTYNPKGEVINFYQSGSFTGLIPEVEVVDRMKMVFV